MLRNLKKIVPLSSFPIGKSPWKEFEISTYTVPLSPSPLENLHGDDLGFSVDSHKNLDVNEQM
jgi:hypothetical protein